MPAISDAELLGAVGTAGTRAPRLTTRMVLRFALVLVPLFAVFVWVYPRIAPAYASGVLVGVNASYRAWSVPLEVRPDGGGGLTAYFALPGGGAETLVTDHTPQNVLLGLILLPTLLLATPIDLGRRLLLLGVGLVLLYLVHVLCLGLLFHELLRLREGRPGPLSDWVLASILTSGQMSSVVLWALLTGGCWFPGALGAARLRRTGSVGRNATCPCGSGRKHKRCCGGAAPAGRSR